MYVNPFIAADAPPAPNPQPNPQPTIGPAGTNIPAQPNPIPGVPATVAGAAGSNIPPEPQPGDTPILDVSKLWQNPTNPDGTPVATPEPGRFLPEISPEQLTNMFGSLDFTKSIKPEQLTAIASGGESAVAAMRDLLNNVGRQVALVNFKAANGMIERGLGTAKDKILADVPNVTTTILADNALAQDHPLMSKPQYQPLVASVRAELQRQYPKASAAQIQTSVRQYFDNMAKDLGATLPAPKQPSFQPQGRTNTVIDGQGNWEDWGNS